MDSPIGNARRSVSASALIAAMMLLSANSYAQQVKPPAEGGLPTCETLLGKWENQLGSTLNITSVDTTSGAINGEYTSPSGGGGSSFPLIGWVNSAAVNEKDPCKECKSDHKKVLTFTVRWGAIGSITAWTGTCGVNGKTKTEQIFTVWNLTRPNSGFEWDHILTGSDIFHPIK